MISYPLALPTTVAPRELTMEQVNQIAETVSPFTGTSQIQEWSAEYWKLSQSYPPMDVVTAADWTSTLAALHGKAGVFYAGTGVGTTPNGTASRITTNLARWTEDFSNGVWSTNQLTVSINAGTPAPDGTITADQLIESSATNVEHYIEQNITAQTIPNLVTFTHSVYARASTRNWFFVGIVQKDASSVPGAWFNLSTGVIGTIVTGGTATITNVGNSWYRCTYTYNVGTGSSAPRIRYRIGNADNGAIYTGSGLSLLVWGSQFELNGTASAYIGETTGTIRVNGANQTGHLLLVDGCPPNSTILKRGDYFQLGAGYSATRVQTSGGSLLSKYYYQALAPSVNGQRYATSIRVKNIGTTTAVISDNLGTATGIGAGSETSVAMTTTGNGVAWYQLHISTQNVSDALDLVLWNPVMRRFGVEENMIPTTNRTFTGWSVNGSSTVTLTQGINQRLYQVVEDTVSDASGNAEISIFPTLRHSPFDDEPPVFSTPKGIFRLDSNSRKFTVNQMKHFGISITAKEAL